MDNDNDQKVTSVSEYINDLTKVLPNEFENVSDSDFRAGIEKIIDNEGFMSRDELAIDLAQTVTRNEEITPEIEVSALKTVLAIDNWQKGNLGKVRKYRANKFEEEFVKKTQEKNPGLTEEKLKLIREKARIVASVEDKMETQTDLAIQSNNQESVGKRLNSWSDLKTMTGFLGMTQKEIDDVVQKNNEISAKLEGVVLPYENFSKVRSFDEIISSGKTITSIKSAPKQLGLINRGIMKVKQFTGGGKGVIQIKNGLVSKVGNQTVDVYVKKSMNTLLQNGFSSGTRSIISGLRTSGVNAGMNGLSVTTKAGNFLKNSFRNGVSNLGIGAKKVLGNSFNKIGGSLIKGLNSAASFSIKSTGLMGLKMIAPIIIGVFVLIIGINLLQINTNISGLVPRLETEEGGDPSEDEDVGGGDGGGSPPKYGEITYSEDGKRVIDCGVGMDAEFTRRFKKPHIPTSGLGNVDSFNKELKEVIGESYGTGCGVVYAAQYLAYDFKYWVPYYFAGKYPKKGLNPQWGEEIRPDDKGRIYRGLDCSAFKNWALINGNGGKGRQVRTVSFGGDCEKIKSIIEPGDLLTLGDGAEGTYHVAVVLAYDNKHIKFAHSGGGSGVSTGLIGLCNGRLVNGSMTFEYLHHKNYN